MNALILATNNAGKCAELQALLAPIRCIPQSELGISDAEETGLSFVENALIKARHASLCAGKPALADDSGLVVLALQGQPGIYSARYAGSGATDQANIDKLLLQMQQVPVTQRQAYFYCALVMVQHATDPTPLIAVGRCDGMIQDIPQGSHGFGYDPVFYVPEYQRTMAQLPADIKQQISHRARAMTDLLAFFKDPL